MSFQKQLRYYREKAGYKSAKKFASLLEVPYTTYISYENKNREPRYNTLKKISKLLGVSIDVLLENTSSESDRVIQDLRGCGFTVTVNNTAKKLKGPVYNIGWGNRYHFEGVEEDEYEYEVVLEQKGLLKVYATINSSLEEMISAISHLKSKLYENELNKIENKRILEFYNFSKLDEKIKNKCPKLYREMNAFKALCKK